MHHHKALTTALTLIAAVAICIFDGQIAGAQQQAIKRTDLLKTYLPETEGKEMQVWVADIPPGAATGPHFHPTPRFVYVLALLSHADAGRASQLQECERDRTG